MAVQSLPKLRALRFRFFSRRIASQQHAALQVVGPDEDIDRVHGQFAAPNRARSTRSTSRALS